MVRAAPGTGMGWGQRGCSSPAAARRCPEERSRTARLCMEQLDPYVPQQRKPFPPSIPPGPETAWPLPVL